MTFFRRGINRLYGIVTNQFTFRMVFKREEVYSETFFSENPKREELKL